MRRSVLTGAAILAAAVVFIVALIAFAGDTAVTAARFSAIRSDHTALRGFLQRLPKGAGLHVHLSGARYAEDLIVWGKAKNLCFDLPTYSITDKNCGTAPAPERCTCRSAP